METAIKRAIEGGWKSTYRYLGSTKSQTIRKFYRFELILQGRSVDTRTDSFVEEEILLDPLFWQALGKAEGWKWEEKTSGAGDSIYVDQIGTDWKTEWHRFIDHIIEGKSIDSFFDELLKVKE